MIGIREDVQEEPMEDYGPLDAFVRLTHESKATVSVRRYGTIVVVRLPGVVREVCAQTVASALIAYAGQVGALQADGYRVVASI